MLAPGKMSVEMPEEINDSGYIASKITSSGFWFVDIPRTSSSSIKVELGRIYGTPFGKENLLEREYSVNQIVPDHLTANEVIGIIGTSAWKNLFTFAIVRNPWERVFSMFNYRKLKGNIPTVWTFRDYVLALTSHSSENEYFKYPGHYRGCSDYVCGDEDAILVSFIGRYEYRERDMLYIDSHCGTQGLGKLHIQQTPVKTAQYSQFYDVEMQNLIAEMYKKDIELFGYSFSGEMS